LFYFFFQAEDGIRYPLVTGVQTCALPIYIAAFIFDLFVMIFAMFYLFRDADQIVRGVRSILPFDAEHRDTLMTQTRNLISASVTTSLILAAIQGGIGGLGFMLVKLPAPLFWGVAMAFFSLVAVVGSGLICFSS